jgi:hypothetical protein
MSHGDETRFSSLILGGIDLKQSNFNNKIVLEFMVGLIMNVT